jgi:hypothetical protein
MYMYLVAHVLPNPIVSDSITPGSEGEQGGVVLMSPDRRCNHTLETSLLRCCHYAHQDTDVDWHPELLTSSI